MVDAGLPVAAVRRRTGAVHCVSRVQAVAAAAAAGVGAQAVARPGSDPAYGFMTWPDTAGTAAADPSGRKGTPIA
ncbi:hypothetical protein [Streptomyces sp. NPDC002054]|uniref:hypothetical protein n=1 Tax=Streptomyces sp. NPDC002054 TaxID=3154663 RepID=UPI0033297121